MFLTALRAASNSHNTWPNLRGAFHAHLRQPARLFVILDERSDSINEGNFATDLSNTGNFSGAGASSPYWWIDTPGSYHNNGVVLSFGDGHVEHHQWLESSTLGPIGVTGPRRPGATDRDIAWLQERAAERKTW